MKANKTTQQYIKKSDLVAEIERRRSKNAKNKLNLAASFEDNYLLSFINTLEVKETNLDKESRVISKVLESLFLLVSMIVLILYC